MNEKDLKNYLEKYVSRYRDYELVHMSEKKMINLNQYKKYCLTCFSTSVYLIDSFVKKEQDPTVSYLTSTYDVINFTSDLKTKLIKKGNIFEGIFNTTTQSYNFVIIHIAKNRNYFVFSKSCILAAQYKILNDYELITLLLKSYLGDVYSLFGYRDPEDKTNFSYETGKLKTEEGDIDLDTIVSKLIGFDKTYENLTTPSGWDFKLNKYDIQNIPVLPGLIKYEKILKNIRLNYIDNADTLDFIIKESCLTQQESFEYLQDWINKDLNKLYSLEDICSLTNKYLEDLLKINGIEIFDEYLNRYEAIKIFYKIGLLNFQDRKIFLSDKFKELILLSKETLIKTYKFQKQSKFKKSKMEIIRNIISFYPFIQ